MQNIHFSFPIGPFRNAAFNNPQPFQGTSTHASWAWAISDPCRPSQPGATTSIGRIRATLLFLSSPHRRVAKSYSTFLNARVLDPVNLLCVVLHSFSFGSEIEGRVLSFTARKPTRPSLSQQRVPGRDCAIPPRSNEKVYIYLGGNGGIRRLWEERLDWYILGTTKTKEE